MVRNFDYEPGSKKSKKGRQETTLLDAFPLSRSTEGEKTTMEKITSLPANSQVLFHFFNFNTCVHSIWLSENETLTEAPMSSEKFEPVEALKIFEDLAPVKKDSQIFLALTEVPPDEHAFILNGRLRIVKVQGNQGLDLPVIPGPDSRPKTRPPLKLVPDPKPAKVTKRKKTLPPVDVLKYFERIDTKTSWQVTLKPMYAQSKYGDIKKIPFNSHRRSHMGRYYALGSKNLATATGQDINTITNHLKFMRENEIIKRRRQGWPGEGNSIYELPHNMDHVMAWKKKPRARK